MMPDINDFEEFIEYVYDNPYEYTVAKRYLRDAENPLECYDNIQFRKTFHFGKDTVINVLLPLLDAPRRNKRGLPIPPVQQLLIALRFYVSGNIQKACANSHKFSQGAISKTVVQVSRTLAMKASQYIRFPASSELPHIKNRFYQQAGIPGVIGCIGCTHVSIKNPSKSSGQVFRNRKGIYSLNVQLVCGPNLEIYDIVAHNPGSVNNSYIFENSQCCRRFEQGELDGILLGDSGYAQSSYMFTPVLNLQTHPQALYNTALNTTRNCFEQLSGVIKQRFACLCKKIGYKITTIPNIVVACAVLHNICIITGEPTPEPRRDEETPVVDVVYDSESASLIRDNFIIRYFS